MILLYWVLMILWLFFGLWSERVPGQPYPFYRAASNIVVFVLLLILGYKVLGFPR